MTSSDDAPTPLEGPSWTAEAYDDSRGELVGLLPGTEITARFEGGRVAGSGGCNRYTATCAMVGTSLEIDHVASTRMACLGPPGVMDQEAAFLAALSTVRGYRLDGNRLSLVSLAQRVAVTFVRSDPSMTD